MLKRFFGYIGRRRVGPLALFVALGGTSYAAIVVLGSSVAVGGFGFAARVLLATVLLVAGVAKLPNRRGFAETVGAFGVPRVLEAPVAAVLPLCEVSLGAALLFPATATAAALGALALLLAFSAATGVALVRGRDVDCGCLGVIRPTRLGPLTLVRNLLLAVLAGWIALQGPSDPQPVALVAPALGIAAAALVVGVSRRRGGEARQTPEAPPLTRRRLLGMVGRAGVGGGLLTLLGTPPWKGEEARAVRSTCGDFCVCPCKLPPPWSCPCCCTGIAGGGQVETASGRAQLAVFGTNLAVGSREPAAVGSLTWTDPGWAGGGLELLAVRIDNYRRLPGRQVRELRGRVTANGDGGHRFVLHVTDAGAPGSGSDTVELRVKGLAPGGAGVGGDEYHARGQLASGDLTTRVLRERTRRRR
jgi:hypothetical protein